MATAKVELTKLKLDNLLPAAPRERYEVADTHVSGLRVRVGDAVVESGKYRGKAAQISFVLLARFPSKPNASPTRRTLGRYSREFPQLTLEAARRKAVEWKAMVAAGKDPAVEAARERAAADEALRAAEVAARSRCTVRQALDRYESEHLHKLRRGKSTRRALDGRSGLLLPFADQDLKCITRQDLAEQVRVRAKLSPISANRQLAYANAFFNWCADEELLDGNPAVRIKKPSKERARDRYHSLEELGEIWKATETLGYPFSHLYRLLIALPMRREELAGLLVAELVLGTDEDPEAVWTLPAARTKRANALRVPLAPLGRSIIIEALKHPDRPSDSAYVFTTKGTSPVSGFAKAKRRLDRAITKARSEAAARGEGDEAVQVESMPHWVVHDLRTTFNTHACEQLGVDAAVADRILNHVATATTSKIMRVYNRSELFEQRRNALSAWESLLRTKVVGGMPDNVVRLSRAASA
ncbi:integrase family protein [Sphingosinicella sp. YJ22]|uniref:integrase family protein n=1 Tax=Sphingosinicella sp. YJ22 TaxID=1104780 RepID=UPI00140C245A|nr:integrase family protein [Sphingosinicella sp. YJ22]